MSLMAANEESDPSAILNGFWVTLFIVAGTAMSAVHVQQEIFVVQSFLHPVFQQFHRFH